MTDTAGAPEVAAAEDSMAQLVLEMETPDKSNEEQSTVIRRVEETSGATVE